MEQRIIPAPWEHQTQNFALLQRNCQQGKWWRNMNIDAWIKKIDPPKKLLAVAWNAKQLPPKSWCKILHRLCLPHVELARSLGWSRLESSVWLIGFFSLTKNISGKLFLDPIQVQFSGHLKWYLWQLEKRLEHVSHRMWFLEFELYICKVG